MDVWFAQLAHGAMGREMINLATALDMVLRGRPAQAADVISQRLKSLEAICHGTHEGALPRSSKFRSRTGPATIAQRNELQVAQEESYQDAKGVKGWRFQRSQRRLLPVWYTLEKAHFVYVCPRGPN